MLCSLQSLSVNEKLEHHGRFAVSSVNYFQLTCPNWLLCKLQCSPSFLMCYYIYPLQLLFLISSIKYFSMDNFFYVFSLMIFMDTIEESHIFLEMWFFFCNQSRLSFWKTISCGNFFLNDFLSAVIMILLLFLLDYYYYYFSKVYVLIGNHLSINIVTFK